jgi:hypothetical protein
MESVNYSKLKKAELLALLEQRDDTLKQVLANELLPFHNLSEINKTLDCENTDYSEFIKEDLLALVNESCVTISNLTAENEALRQHDIAQDFKIELLSDEIMGLKRWKLDRFDFIKILHESKTFNFFNRIFKWDTTWL